MLAELEVAEVLADLLVPFDLPRACADDSLVDFVLGKREQLRKREVDLYVDEEGGNIYANDGGLHVILPLVYLSVIGVAFCWERAFVAVEAPYHVDQVEHDIFAAPIRVFNAELDHQQQMLELGRLELFLHTLLSFPFSLLLQPSH